MPCPLSDGWLYVNFTQNLKQAKRWREKDKENRREAPGAHDPCPLGFLAHIPGFLTCPCLPTHDLDIDPAMLSGLQGARSRASLGVLHSGSETNSVGGRPETLVRLSLCPPIDFMPNSHRSKAWLGSVKSSHSSQTQGLESNPICHRVPTCHPNAPLLPKL